MRPHPISENIFKRLRDKMEGGVHHQFVNGETPPICLGVVNGGMSSIYCLKKIIRPYN